MADLVFPQYEPWHLYYETDVYPYRYFTVSPVAGSYADNADITIQYTMQYFGEWSSGTIDGINFVELWFYDDTGNCLGYEDAADYAENSISGDSGSTIVHLAQCANSYRVTAARIEVLIETQFHVKLQNGNASIFDVPVSNANLELPTFALTHYSVCGVPVDPVLSQTVSRGAVKLSWGAGDDGTNNSVTGYDVQRRLSSDGSSWGSWEDVSGSPVTGTSLSVSPPDTVGSYYQYQVRTRGSAGSDYYSDWVTSTNTLRRKWDAFGAWTDEALTAGVSGIRAVHLTQLQERIAVIRAFYGLSAYSFTAVTARKTKIATWAALIGELRGAIDGITTNHAAWNTLQAGKPRIAHITQLRDIIDNM